MINPISNSSVLSARHTLSRNQASLNTALQRLSTGKKIYSGKDNPAGLITSEQLAATITALEAESKALGRMDSNANIVEGHASQVSVMLSELNGLVVQGANSAGMSDAERDAIQLQIDNTVEGIQRITGDAVSSMGGVSLPGNGNAEVVAMLNGASAAAASVTSSGANSLASGNFQAAQASIQGAISDVATARGSVGAYQKYTIQSTRVSNQVAIENLIEAKSLITDTDFAVETGNLEKFNTLVRSGLHLLVKAQQNAKYMLSMLA